MTRKKLLRRIMIDPKVCGGQACIRGTRVPVSVILDGLAEGLTAGDLIDHYPQLKNDDVYAALAYASELSRENNWKLAI